MKLRYNALVIGAGNIGAFYDRPDVPAILSHAHAYHRHEGFNLIGFIDTDHEKAQNASMLWGGRAFRSLAEAIHEYPVDVVSVAVPDAQHYSVLKSLARLPIRLIFGEKPLAATMAEAQDLLRIFPDGSIPVCINYRRRFVPEFAHLHDNIQSGHYGRYVTGSGYYGKGFLHNGSHVIDLLRYFLGEIQDARIHSTIQDYAHDDPSVAAVLTFLNTGNHFYLQPVDSNLYTIFELDLLFEKKRIRIKDTGFFIEEHDIRQDDTFPGYMMMRETREIRTSLDRSLYHSAVNIYGHLTNHEPLKCPLLEGFKTMETAMKILSSR